MSAKKGKRKSKPVYTTYVDRKGKPAKTNRGRPYPIHSPDLSKALEEKRLRNLYELYRFRMQGNKMPMKVIKPGLPNTKMHIKEIETNLEKLLTGKSKKKK